MLNKLGFTLLIIMLVLIAAPQIPSKAQSNGTYYITAATANARSCARTNCSVVTKFSKGTAIEVTGTTEGSSFQGSTTWLNVNYDGETVYVHSKLASTTAPATPRPNNSGNSNNGSTSATPTAPPSGGSAPCSCEANLYNCADFSPRSNAQVCYNHCISQGRGDIHDLDRDNDGLACER